MVGLCWACVALLCGCSAVCAAEAVSPAPTVTPTPVPTPVTLRVDVGREGSTIDPAYLPETDPGDYLGHLFEGLMKYVPAENGAAVSDLQVVYGLAESVEISGDGLEYRFTLRRDALWSDGQPVTAEDFVYAWQRVLDIGRSPGAAVMGKVLERFYAASDRVLVVELQRVCPWFLRLCAAHYMVPVRRDVIERYGGDWTDEAHIVVSGAYTIESWVHDDSMTMVPNPYYYDRAGLGPQVLEWCFGTGTDCRVTAEEGNGSGFLYFNTVSIRDWRVRAAMVLAVDREALGEPAAGLVPGGGTALYDWLGERYTRYDVTTLAGRRQLARDLMSNARAAGTWYSGYTLYYRVTDDPAQQAIARQCIDDWRQELGLQVEPVETEDYGQALSSMRFDIAYVECRPAYDDPMAYLQLMERGGSDNRTAWGDVRYDDLLARAEETMDPAARQALLMEAERFLFSEGGFAICPLVWKQPTYQVKGVTGIGYGNGEWRFQYGMLKP